MFLERLDSRRLFFVVLIVKFLFERYDYRKFLLQYPSYGISLTQFLFFHFQFIYGYLLTHSFRKLLVIIGGFLLLEYSIQFLYKNHTPHIFPLVLLFDRECSLICRLYYHFTNSSVLS